MPRNVALVDLNDTLIVDCAPCTPWEFLPGVVEATRLLVRTCGWHMAIVTQQPPKYWGPKVTHGDVMHWLAGIGRALRDAADLALPVSMFACVHDANDGCDCRKPSPGLLRRALTGREPRESVVWMIGDKWSDVMAGHNAGVKTCAVGDFGYLQKGTTPLPEGLKPPHLWVPDFPAAVRIITSEVLV